MKLKRLFPLLLLGLFFYFVFQIPKKVTINEVVCETQYGPCPEKLANDLSALVGKNYSEVKKELAGIVKSNEVASAYTSQFNLPDKLKVNIILRKAIGAVTTSEKGSFSLIDKDGFVLTIEEATALPIVVVETKPPNVGENVSDEVLFSSLLLSKIYDRFGVAEGFLKTYSFETRLKTGLNVIFPNEGDPDILMASLETILSRLNSNESDTKLKNVNQGFSTLDLRFKNPVLK